MVLAEAADILVREMERQIIKQAMKENVSHCKNLVNEVHLNLMCVLVGVSCASCDMPGHLQEARSGPWCIGKQPAGGGG